MIQRKFLWKIFFITSLFAVIPLLAFVFISDIKPNLLLLLSVIIISLIIVFTALSILLGPVDVIKSGAERYTQGDYSAKIFPPKEKHLKSIAESLNTMAKQLDERLDIIGEQSNLQQAVLESMKEGVLAVDYEERILMLNKTAERILDIASIDAKGRTLQEVVRISEIQKFFKKLLSEGSPQEAEIILQHDRDKFLQLSGTLLYDVDNKALGALVVLNDISNLKHLDTIKKDLVANVSHELKTPVTTIKGFIETLKEGAIDDPKNAERFLNIVSKHIDRLNLLIDDLLTLSRLEEMDEEVQLEDEEIKPLLQSVVEDYDFIAGEKKITLNVKCDDNIFARTNRHLIEQAIGNLLDNAIKYSDKKSKVEVGAFEQDGMLNIYVEDEGYGIDPEHISRLFERFYRIDKGRSREEGGTGLGLAIVKHIVNVLGGNIEVESQPGKGSVFTIKIPKN
ncbi:MAG: ATP-binding protein [Chlorobi bacterium]|nr:ATP-binding protein [Chlorobiota bacterium]MCI0716125.1 ATP-binding protein [Chlorobiota bacterium]